MPSNDPIVCCPDCGAAVTLLVEASDSSESGVLVCEHSHVYDLSDPRDDRRLQDVLGSTYRQRILSLVHREPLTATSAMSAVSGQHLPHV